MVERKKFSIKIQKHYIYQIYFTLKSWILMMLGILIFSLLRDQESSLYKTQSHKPKHVRVQLINLESFLSHKRING